MKFKAMLFALIASSGLALAQPQAQANPCCAALPACCQPGADCCTPDADCCKPDADCCAPGADCCK